MEEEEEEEEVWWRKHLEEVGVIKGSNRPHPTALNFANGRYTLQHLKKEFSQ